MSWLPQKQQQRVTRNETSNQRSRGSFPFQTYARRSCAAVARDLTEIMQNAAFIFLQIKTVMEVSLQECVVTEL